MASEWLVGLLTHTEHSVGGPVCGGAGFWYNNCGGSC